MKVTNSAAIFSRYLQKKLLFTLSEPDQLLKIQDAWRRSRCGPSALPKREDVWHPQNIMLAPASERKQRQTTGTSTGGKRRADGTRRRPRRGRCLRVSRCVWIEETSRTTTRRRPSEHGKQWRTVRVAAASGGWGLKQKSMLWLREFIELPITIVVPLCWRLRVF